MNELKIPQAAFKDKNSFELLRVWAAFEEQHVTIRSELNGQAKEFGFLLAELALHGAKLYAQRSGTSETDALKEILDEFNHEIINETGGPSGHIEE
ncbi:DUF5076 domain-containing protein [Mucilaginibacter pocheonensis]|uniref:DUF5076 domain-containing protein n=1 Tax=Mucilaginibacter pocheonensis TaxID=398050 RepID=A0ABU1TJS2_9SPHI|nr:DUF5076 domain-containing protein [Mucilaginibacter pocheonensis]MDR6945061.1 hypothetical protein [Mucilaginibacter pocheonensis]